jgi:hypothetical protein
MPEQNQPTVEITFNDFSQEAEPEIYILTIPQLLACLDECIDAIYKGERNEEELKAAAVFGITGK